MSPRWCSRRFRASPPARCASRLPQHYRHPPPKLMEVTDNVLIGEAALQDALELGRRWRDLRVEPPPDPQCVAGRARWVSPTRTVPGDTGNTSTDRSSSGGGRSATSGGAARSWTPPTAVIVT